MVVAEVVLAIVEVNAMVHAVALVDLDVLEVVLVVQHSRYIDEGKFTVLERRNGEEHNVHRHKGLSIGL